MKKKALLLSLMIGMGGFAMSSGASADAHSSPDNNINLPGDDIRNLNVGSSWRGCAYECEGEDSCRSWTYRKSDGVCYLKNGEPQHVHDERFSSGYMRNR